MRPDQIVLLQSSYARVKRIGPHFAASFFRELFITDPSLRRMFRGDMVVQGEQLMTALDYMVEGMNEPEKVLPDVRALGVRHLDFGVEAHHYVTLGTALLRTLKHELDADFTRETRAAWEAAYKLISDAMVEAAYGASADATALLRQA